MKMFSIHFIHLLYSVFLIIVVLLINGYETESFSLKEQSSIIINIRDTFESNCIHLVRSSNFNDIGDQPRFVALYKSLSTPLIPTPTIVIELQDYFNNYKEIQEECTRSVIVLLTSNNDDRLNLIEATNGNHSYMFAKPTWLLFLDSVHTLADYFADIDIRFDCEFLVVEKTEGVIKITEVYRVKSSNPLQTYNFGNWSQEVGFQSTKLEFYERRHDLQEITLTCVVHVEEPPIFMVENIGLDTQNVHGYFGDVFRNLQEGLNFKVNYSMHNDDTYGSIDNATGEWIGMIGSLVRKEADVGINGYLRTKERSIAIDFTKPIYLMDVKIYILEPSNAAFRWTSFFEPFSTTMWILIAILIIIIGVLLGSFHSLNKSDEQTTDFSCAGSIFCVLGLFLHQGCVVTPRVLSCRVIFLTAGFTSLILMASYSAMLISCLTVRTLDLPFTDQYGLMDDETYDIGVHDMPLNFTLFGRAENYLQTKLEERIAKSKLRNEGIEYKRVCRGKYALIMGSDSATYITKDVPCKIVSLPRTVLREGVMMAMIKHSPYRGVFNYRLTKLQSGGIVRKLTSDDWNEISNRQVDQTNKEDVIVEMDDIIPLIALLVLFIVLAIILLLCENLRYKIKQRLPIRYKKRTMSDILVKVIKAVTFNEWK